MEENRAGEMTELADNNLQFKTRASGETSEEGDIWANKAFKEC